MYEIIDKKRNGLELTDNEIRDVIARFTNSEIPDYQMSALLMAICINGMTPTETFALTQAMIDSGEILDLSSIRGIKVDKHSTGGVGDKTTLIVGPTVAACGVPVAKMSGRGLGHTGGTIDKLESIPGLKTLMPISEFIANVNAVGISIADKIGNIAPADKKIYALRDVTATVRSLPLIASSIMSKKIASGADCIVLDVKYGNGAFMKTRAEAEDLADLMNKIGNSAGIKTSSIITSMEVPLGRCVGNILEVKECMQVLGSFKEGLEDLFEVSLDIVSEMLHLAGKGEISECRAMAIDAIESGRALAKFKDFVVRQGGDWASIEGEKNPHPCEYSYELRSERSGRIISMDTTSLGVAAVELGSGRKMLGAQIDFGAGIIVEKKTGNFVEKGEILATIFANCEENLLSASEVLKGCWKYD
ncbi:MAG: thymidine phosphorylase [Bacillota bacterium]